MGLAYDLFRRTLSLLNRVAPEPLTYYQDGLYTIHNADFISEPRFAQAYSRAMETAHGHGPNLHIEWRVFVCCWAATQAMAIEGDFVECGVNSGMYSRAVVDYVSFGASDRKFYLMDTFEGMPADQFLPGEIDRGLKRRYEYGPQLEAVRKTFGAFPNVVVVPGKIPDSLAEVDAKAVSYLSLDMNAVVPEIAAAEYFWDRLSPGAIVVLDDYGWRMHVHQKRAFDAFAAERDIRVLAMPTGQGLLVKPK